MSDNTKKQKNIMRTNANDHTCQISQEQARREMKKEDERKQISKMMENI
jgi:hypothetical protein